MKLLLFISIFFLSASLFPVHAFEMKSRDHVVVDQDTVGSLFVAGNTLTVNGNVDGDLYCAGQTIDIKGNIRGDVLCAGQTITISGAVSGSVRSVGQTITITSAVGRNVTVAGQSVTMSPTAVVSGELFGAGQTIAVEGRVLKGILTAGETIRINSAITGQVQAYAKKLYLDEKARVAGPLTYTSPELVVLAPQATVSGTVTHLLPEKSEAMAKSGAMRSQFKRFSRPAGIVAKVIFFLTLGFLLAFLAPLWTVKATQSMKDKPWYSMLVGFVVSLVVPVVFITIAITIIGIPIAILLLFVFMFAMLMSRVLAAIVLGGKILESLGQKKISLYAQVFLGVPVTWLLFQIPYLGMLLTFVAMLWGLGGIASSFANKKAKR